MKKVVILGSTGSIGRSTLNVIRMFPDRFKVVGLTAGSNLDLLNEQIEEFSPEVVAVSEGADNLKNKKNTRVLAGMSGICEVASSYDADIVISAISGSAGLLPTLSAIQSGKTVGLANKETMVMAGDLVLREAARTGAKLIPVDSEHSAIFQCLQGHPRKEVRRVILTASGGPFRGKSLASLEDVKPEDALAHPTWNMGRKITIDSATLMNKGLEVIEAYYLFGFSPDQIDVVIHPESIVHSFVEFHDGMMLAQVSVPDMKGPIAYALSYPERLNGIIRECNLPELGTLTFQKPQNDVFPCLDLAYQALRKGGSAPLILNAANEVAVAGFLDGVISFNQIPVIINKVMDSLTPGMVSGIDEVLNLDKEARKRAEEFVRNKN